LEDRYGKAEAVTLRAQFFDPTNPIDNTISEKTISSYGARAPVGSIAALAAPHLAAVDPTKFSPVAADDETL
jgi:hypothetical protein